MRAKLSQSVRALANGAASGEDANPVMRGVHITKKEAVVADCFILVVKAVQSQEMELEQVKDDGINEVNVPADALKACKGDEVQLQTIEAVRSLPSGELLAAVVRLQLPR